MNRKSELICDICKFILKDPVSLPCSHTVCFEHLRDGTVKNGSIRCLKCEKDFYVPRNGFEANSALANLLANESHLSDEEKSIKCAIQGLVKQLEQLQGSVNLKRDVMELANCNHFIEIRR